MTTTELKVVLLWRVFNTLCTHRGCKNRAWSVSWLEVIKSLPHWGITLCVSYDRFFCLSFVFLVYVVFCFLVVGYQYQCNWLPGKTRLWNDILCVEWDVKIHSTLTPIYLSCHIRAWKTTRDLCPLESFGTTPVMCIVIWDYASSQNYIDCKFIFRGEWARDSVQT